MSNLCLIAASLVAHGQAPGWQLSVPPPAKTGRTIPVGTTTALSRLCDTVPQSVLVQSSIVGGEGANRPEFSRQGRNRISLMSAISRVLKPSSGGQLYYQRIAALAAGQLYTRLPPDSFVEAWMGVKPQPTYQQWNRLLNREADVMAKSQGPARMTVILGDSNALWFPHENLSKDRFWLNQGISGDTTAGVLQRVAVLDQTRPDTIHVMVGINDLRRGKSDNEILTNLRQIMAKLRQAHPTAQIYVHSILPTRLAAIPSSRIRWLNYNIASVAQEEQVGFLNLQPAFADASGNLRRALTTDGVHLSAQGYHVWHMAVSPIL